ncbi:MAG TPA: type II toxin-antitoxin system RelE/ParE family toxin [Tepidisphaeraceae bacterium]|jgi:plasmid stabilization system protein ParE
MNAYRVEITARALTDIKTIERYIAVHSPARAARFIDRLLMAIDGLSPIPQHNVARRTEDNPWPVRSLPVGAYIIYFRVDEHSSVIRILTIRYGSRRSPRKFD